MTLTLIIHDYYKTLRHIPELMGYQLGKILMVEHKRVDPPELHLKVSEFIFYPERPELSDQDYGLAKIIRRLDILLQVDNILKLRQQEDEQRMLASQKRADWAQAKGISLFNDNYSEIMSTCPIPNFKAIDE